MPILEVLKQSGTRTLKHTKSAHMKRKLNIDPNDTEAMTDLGQRHLVCFCIALLVIRRSPRSSVPLDILVPLGIPSLDPYPSLDSLRYP